MKQTKSVIILEYKSYYLLDICFLVNCYFFVEICDIIYCFVTTVMKAIILVKMMLKKLLKKNTTFHYIRKVFSIRLKSYFTNPKYILFMVILI